MMEEIYDSYLNTFRTNELKHKAW